MSEYSEASDAMYRRSNTLGLAVLGLLWEGDSHPYEMASTLRERHQESSVKLNYGSLYTVVEALLKHGLVRAVGTVRDGNRPARTVYGLTDSGRVELHDWLRELIAEPAKEYPRFEAGVALIGLLPPEEAIELCERRAEALDGQLLALAEVTAALTAQGLPQLAWIELEYRVAMTRAERDWVRWFADTARRGELGGQEFWRDLHTGDRAGNVRTTKEEDVDG